MNKRSSRASPARRSKVATKAAPKAAGKAQPRFPFGQAVLPPGVVPEGTRRRILEAALQLFASQGFHGVSVRDLARGLAVVEAICGQFYIAVLVAELIGRRSNQHPPTPPSGSP